MGESTIVINSDIQKVWHAVTNEKELTQWYAPGSPWEIPKLQMGETMYFTLMPSGHNHLEEPLRMSLTIVDIIPNQLFSFQMDADETLISFELVPENNGTKVIINMEGYEMSLANLKALVEGE
ncbi:SRPBCC family protein [Gracilibacillus alcaliphilus]|uniref:SRPBCC family protein n=1 Tax=Gracilibacillus alcaliphilus TaxID=1401441 RepID=UPI0019571B80|nr:SRPBCC domain-containing protein [Gracilibacillus alcaliphilus]MBM7675596.1 uncharacterized protein YndB with AHSA1/START domain [Gracilibacillus alcaliphilus]